MRELPVATKPPGYATKITLWQRIVNWYWNWRYPLKSFVPTVYPNQAAIDRIYNLQQDKLKQTLMPPINRKE